MPKFPLPPTGACEQDRFFGIKLLKELGYDVSVIAKYSPGKPENFDAIGRDLGIKIFPVTYKFSAQIPFRKRALGYLRRIINPLLWDGAAYEYVDREIQDVLAERLDRERPDLVWFDYTYLWPLYGIVRKRNIPIITRSVNFEPSHFLQEDGYSILNLMKFMAKLMSELLMVRRSDLIYSITPKEKAIYEKLGAKNVVNLPLRGLSDFDQSGHEVKEKDILDVFFMGSTYNVHHNKRVLKFILRKIIPATKSAAPGKFRFHILGAKFPDSLRRFLDKEVIYHGYVDDLSRFIVGMDIALVPYLSGAGMQQKIFEPLTRGIPTLTSSGGLGGYPFRGGEHLILAENASAFAEGLIAMRDTRLRKKLSENSISLSRKLFSHEKILAVISGSLNDIKK